MDTLTRAQLETKIDSFLEAKAAKYPDLNHGAIHKARWDVGGLWTKVEKIISHH